MNKEENNIIQCFDEKLDLLNKIHNATLELDNNKIEEKDKEIERLTKRLEESQLAFLQVDKEIERLKEDNEYLNKVNIELSTEKNRLNNIIKKLERLVDDYAWNSYYIKCGNRYLKSEILNDIREIIELKGVNKE